MSHADPTPSSAVEAFLSAMVQRDEAALRDLFAPDVWVRALLVRSLVEAHDAAAAAALVSGWVAGDGLVVLDTEHEPLAGRERLRYRLVLQPSWAPDTWHVIEQTGFAKVVGGRIARLDLACSGYWPISDPGGPPVWATTTEMAT